MTDKQGEELATLINTIEESEVCQSTRDGILGEAENSGEGGGELMRAIWNNAKEKASFFRDQARNSKATLLNIMDVYYLSLHSRNRFNWEQMEPDYIQNRCVCVCVCVRVRACVYM